ncbi:hypothetical protein [Streptomyces sp. NPDC059631]|uniref:hypothetical protein n=1 Tax=unclassified Streptomyces TaxID=2593676 RepID=UPI0036C78A1E
MKASPPGAETVGWEAEVRRTVARWHRTVLTALVYESGEHLPGRPPPDNESPWGSGLRRRPATRM